MIERKHKQRSFVQVADMGQPTVWAWFVEWAEPGVLVWVHTHSCVFMGKLHKETSSCSLAVLGGEIVRNFYVNIM